MTDPHPAIRAHYAKLALKRLRAYPENKGAEIRERIAAEALTEIREIASPEWLPVARFIAVCDAIHDVLGEPAAREFWTDLMRDSYDHGLLKPLTVLAQFSAGQSGASKLLRTAPQAWALSTRGCGEIEVIDEGSAGMRLGIDLGTTRTIVAFHDRGNYPSVAFVTPEGDWVDHFPTVTAEVNGQLVHGLDAEAAEREGAPSLRSWKRLLATTRQDETITIGRVAVTPSELVTGFLSALRRDLAARSNVAKLVREPLEAVISVPANAHSTQRFVTLDAFRRAGFSTRAVINEPSAAGIEYAHRHANTLSARREHVIVYDLGGGTFDAALVHIAGGHHDVALTSGIPALGGDDFDRALLDLAMERAGLAGGPTPRGLAECRGVKESIHANTKKIVIDLDTPVVIPVSDFYDRVRPLVEATLTALEPIVSALSQDEIAGDIAGIYMVGGASGLPIVHRVVREHFGRRVHRSPQPAAATAIGCAILAVEGEAAEPLALSEQIGRASGRERV